MRKTDVIQRQLGSAGQVIEQRIKDRMATAGIDRGKAEALARSIEEETDLRVSRFPAPLAGDRRRPADARRAEAPPRFLQAVQRRR